MNPDIDEKEELEKVEEEEFNANLPEDEDFEEGSAPVEGVFDEKEDNLQVEECSIHLE